MSDKTGRKALATPTCRESLQELWEVIVRERKRERNEGLTGLRHDALGFVWDAGNHLPETYNVYRGDRQVLVDQGIYTQDPLSIPGARHFCGLSVTRLDDADNPAPGQIFIYLASAAGVVEGSLGLDGNLVERPRDLACSSL